MQLSTVFTAERIEKLMLICVIGYALFKLAYRATGDIFLGVLLIGTIVVIIKERQYFFKDKIFLLLLAALIVQPISWLYGKYFTPYEVGKFTLSPLANLFYFICLAYWLKGRPLYVMLTLFAFSIGVILTCFSHSPDPIAEFIAGLGGSRVDFAVTNANHPATLAGAAVITTILIYFLITQYRHYVSSRLVFILATTSCLILLAVHLLLVYMTQSRAILLALFFVLCFTCLYVVIKRHKSFSHAIFLSVIACTVVVTIVFAVMQVSTLKARLFSEQEIIEQIIPNRAEEIPESSVGIRIKLWTSTLSWVQQYPLLGLGDREARNFVIEQSPYFEQVFKDEYSHLHQGHLEVLVSYGLLGLLIVWGIYFYVIRTAFLVAPPYRQYVIWGSISFTIYYFTANAFESFFFFKSGEQLHNVVLGCLYSFYLTQRMQSIQYRR